MEKLGCASCEGGWLFTHPFQTFHGKVSHRLMESSAMKMKLEGEAVEDVKEDCNLMLSRTSLEMEQ